MIFLVILKIFVQHLGGLRIHVKLSIDADNPLDCLAISSVILNKVEVDFLRLDKLILGFIPHA